MKLLTTEEAATVLHVTPRTIQRWAREGRIQYTRIGRRILISRTDMEVIANAYTTPAHDYRATIPNPHYTRQAAIVIPMKHQSTRSA